MERELVERLLTDLEQLRSQLGSAKGEAASAHAPTSAPLATPPSSAAIDRGAWLAGLLALSPDVISVMDSAGTLLYVSRTVFGGDTSGLIGKEAASYVPESHREVWRGAVRRAVETGEPQHVEVHSIGEFWWDSRIAPLRGPAGEVEYLLSIGTDTTARKRAEAALEVTGHQLAMALEASGMGQWRWDVASQRITWDEAARRLFGWDGESQLTDGSFMDVVHPDDRERVNLHVEHAVRTGEHRNLEYRVIVRGAPRWMLATGKVLRGADGVVHALLGGLVDITATKQREAGLERARKLEAIGQLAAGIAHDFNNLLVAMSGSIELARLTPDPAAREGFLEGAMKATQRAADLTRQLLAFGRRQPLHETPLAMNDLLEDTAQLLRRLIPESIQMDLLLAHRLPAFLGDRGQVEQVVLNLCINARDAMPAGGRIVIETEAVLVNGRFRETHPWVRSGRYVLLSVSDTGIGMSADTLERVFEPFFTTKDHGSGLGLATTYGIVKQHGGFIHGYSEIEKGSTFKVYLPVAERDAAEVGPKIDTPAVGGTETILLVEDEEPVREIVGRILSRAGYRVLVARDGVEAVAVFTESGNDIDLVLLDAIMPRMSGTDALVKIRELRADVRAIISSGYSDALATVRQRGVDFLQKPYEPDALLRIVREVLERPVPAEGD